MASSCAHRTSVLKRNAATAAEVLELCDGQRSLDEIVVALSTRYDGADLDDDVRGLVDAMSQKGLVVEGGD